MRLSRFLWMCLSFTGFGLEGRQAVVQPPEPPGLPSFEVVGDSILFGSGLADDSKGLRPEKAFPALLAAKLGMKADLQGWSGAQAGRIAARYPMKTDETQGVRRGDPQWILVNLGANHRTQSRREYTGQLESLVNRIVEENPGKPIILLNFFRMRPDRLGTLRAVARDREKEADIQVWDVRACLVGYTDAGIHPDRESHRRLADVLAEKLSSMKR